MTTPREKLIPKMASVADYSDSQVKAVAAAEVLGAAGLILPALLDITPILVPARRRRGSVAVVIDGLGFDDGANR